MTTGRLKSKGRRVVKHSFKEADFVGRRNELTNLESNLLNVRDEGVSIVGILGEAGVGKSRLVKEAIEKVDGLDYLIGYASALRENEPFYVVRDMLRNRFTSSDFLVEETRELGMTDEETAFMEILYGSSSGFGDFDSDILRMRLGKTFLMYVEKLAEKGQRAPVVVVEDTHFIDKGSEELLNYVVKRLKPRSGFVFTNRLEEEVDKINIPDIREQGFKPEIIILEPFTEGDSKELLKQYRVDDEGVIAASEGYPLRLEHLAIGRRLKIETNDYLESVIHRVERLSEIDKRAVVCAAILRSEFDSKLLNKMLGMELDLTDLVGLRLLRKVGDKYVIDHDKVAGAVLQGTTEDVLKRLHVEAAKAYESVYGGVDDFTDNILHHYLSGFGDDVRTKTVLYLDKAGSKAKSLGIINEAEIKLRKAIDLLKYETSLDGSNSCLEIQLELCNLLDAVSDVRVYDEREIAFRKVNPEIHTLKSSYRSLLGLALNDLDRGNFERAFQRAEMVEPYVSYGLDEILKKRDLLLTLTATAPDKIEEDERLTDEEKRRLFKYDKYNFNILLTKGRIHYFNSLVVDDPGFSREAKKFHNKALNLVKTRFDLSDGEVLEHSSYPVAVADINVALSAMEIGEIDPAKVALDEAKEICDRENFVVLGCYETNVRARYLTTIGDYDEALPILDRGVKLADEIKNLSLRLFLLDTAGDLYRRLRRKDDALKSYKDALSLLVERGRLIAGNVNDEEAIKAGDLYKFAGIFNRKIQRV